MMTKAMTNFCIFPLNCSSAYLEKVRVEPMSCVFCFEAGQTHPVLAELCKGSVTPRVLACRHLPHLVLLPCCFWDFHSVSGPSWTFTFSCFSRLSTSTSADTLLRLALPFSFFLLLLFSLFFFFFFFFFLCAHSRRRNVFTMDSLQPRRAGGAATGTMDTERRRL
ncbi:hypothetical protein JOL62DRAFT_226448 [Phyllosticta paracitricarpa]|uniref:Transmembrane protein n=1 Tax=Phyllosticta paracitricarpa TaxID=2016321 RepID=A0ABR1NK38_9PEZI